MDYESRIIFAGQQIQIGEWRCYPDSSLWGQENIAGHLPMLVFPRTSVQIHQADRDLQVTSTNQIVYYNAHQTYRRGLVSRRGDICEYVFVCPETLVEMYRSLGLPEPEKLDSPFDFGHSTCDSSSFLMQRSLYKYVSTTKNPDPVLVEESFLSILARVLQRAIQTNSPAKPLKRSTIQTHRLQVEIAKEYLAKHWTERVSLDDIAAACECSVFHLCRIFKHYTGSPIAQFLANIRLHNSLESVIDTDTDLIHIALQSGFCSHSHMTRYFGREFGLRPSEIRRLSPPELIRKIGTQFKTDG